MKKVLYNGATLFILLSIIYLSLTSRSVGVQISHMDKVQHALAYSVLAFFMTHAIGSWGYNRQKYIISFVLCTLIGGVLEIVQSRYGRLMELGDFTANMFGAILGCLAVRLGS